MKILFIIGNLESGGAEKVVSTLANVFSPANDIGILMISTSKNESFYEINSKVNIIPLLNNEKRLSFFKKTKKIRDAIESFNPDVVVSFLNYVIIYTWLAFKKLKKNIKFIVSERNDPNNVPSTFLFRMIRNHIFSKADGCVFQTEDAKKYFKNIKSSIVIPNPVFIKRDFVFNYKKQERDKIVLLVGSNKKEKNRVMAYKSFSKFVDKYPDYKMVVVGTLPNKKERAQVKKLGAKDKICFVGKETNWHQKYQSAAMFILTSNYEGMPNALLEATALQIPCISTDCPIGGPKDILENGKNGILINVKDGKDLTNQMEKLVENKEICNQFSEHCSSISTKYDPKVISDEWMKYIKSLM